MDETKITWPEEKILMPLFSVRSLLVAQQKDYGRFFAKPVEFKLFSSLDSFLQTKINPKLSKFKALLLDLDCLKEDYSQLKKFIFGEMFCKKHSAEVAAKICCSTDLPVFVSGGQMITETVFSAIWPEYEDLFLPRRYINKLVDTEMSKFIPFFYYPKRTDFSALLDEAPFRKKAFWIFWNDGQKAERWRNDLIWLMRYPNSLLVRLPEK